MAHKPKLSLVRETHLQPLTEDERLAWLRLVRSENVGPVSFYHLLDRYGSAEDALRRLPEIAHRAGRGRPLVIPSLREVTHEYMACQEQGIRLIARGEPDYPPLLNALGDAPPLISVLGDPALLKKPLFAIVGARNASTLGCRLARSFAQDLGEHFGIVSGLARGIDTHAHQGALKTGTVAVLAGGLSQIYPPENKDLAHSIAAQGGVVLSEAPLTQPPIAELFPKRNRLISGMSWGVLVVEAALKSGSLVTARYAADQGREVFAIPGNPLDPRARGTNGLIVDGALLTQRPSDIWEAYGRLNRVAREDPAPYQVGPLKLSEDQVDQVRRVLREVLSPSPIEVNVLAQMNGFPVAWVRAALVEMEIAGYLDRHPGDRVSLLSYAAEGSQ